MIKRLVRVSRIKEGDLVMLKVEPRFKLDRSFRGPYCVYTITDTCEHIRPINKPSDDLITVSLQRLSRCCSEQLGAAKPWMGHGKTRKRRELRRNKQTDGSQLMESSVSGSTEQSTQTTRRGRPIKKPARYCLSINSSPQVSAFQEGGSCKDESHEKGRVS